MLPNEYAIDVPIFQRQCYLSKLCIFHTDNTNFQLLFVNLFYIYPVNMA